MSRLAGYFSLMLICSSCANIITPSGGEKDITPPVLVAAMPPERSTLFDKRKIELRFDEYVTVNDLSANLIVSPSLSSLPEVTVRKRSVIISLPGDTLRPSATYSLNFGDAIRDVNEGNPLRNFQYVFSTGEWLDSLSLSGSVYESPSLLPANEALVMLYTGEDSSFIRGKPFYFTRTSSDGNFTLSNLSPGTYRLFALKDKNLSYSFDDPAEAVGYLEHPVELISKMNPPVSLPLFVSDPPGIRLESAASPYAGAILLNFTSAVKSEELLASAPGTFEQRGDSIWYFPDEPDTTNQYFLWQTPGGLDTIRVKLSGRKPGGFFSVKTIHPVIRPTEIIRLRSLYPVEALFEERAVLYEDSIRVQKWKLDYAGRDIFLAYPWSAASGYNFVMKGGAATDIHNNLNDSASWQFTTLAEESYGSLKFSIILPDTGSWFAELIDISKSKTIKRPLVPGKQVLNYRLIEPGTYEFRIINDADRDGAWDTGSLFIAQPEKIYLYPERITLRANWDVELEINVVASSLR